MGVCRYFLSRNNVVKFRFREFALSFVHKIFLFNNSGVPYIEITSVSDMSGSREMSFRLKITYIQLTHPKSRWASGQGVRLASSETRVRTTSAPE